MSPPEPRDQPKPINRAYTAATKGDIYSTHFGNFTHGRGGHVDVAEIGSIKSKSIEGFLFLFNDQKGPNELLISDRHPPPTHRRSHGTSLCPLGAPCARTIATSAVDSPLPPALAAPRVLSPTPEDSFVSRSNKIHLCVTCWLTCLLTPTGTVVRVRVTIEGLKVLQSIFRNIYIHILIRLAA